MQGEYPEAKQDQLWHDADLRQDIQRYAKNTSLLPPARPPPPHLYNSPPAARTTSKHGGGSRAAGREPATQSRTGQKLTRSALPTLDQDQTIWKSLFEKTYLDYEDFADACRRKLSIGSVLQDTGLESARTAPASPTDLLSRLANEITQRKKTPMVWLRVLVDRAISPDFTLFPMIDLVDRPPRVDLQWDVRFKLETQDYPLPPTQRPVGMQGSSEFPGPQWFAPERQILVEFTLPASGPELLLKNAYALRLCSDDSDMRNRNPLILKQPSRRTRRSDLLGASESCRWWLVVMGSTRFGPSHIEPDLTVLPNEYYNKELDPIPPGAFHQSILNSYATYRLMLLEDCSPGMPPLPGSDERSGVTQSSDPEVAHVCRLRRWVEWDTATVARLRHAAEKTGNPRHSFRVIQDRNFETSSGTVSGLETRVGGANSIPVSWMDEQVLRLDEADFERILLKSDPGELLLSPVADLSLYDLP
ncbi:hypothetical protein OH77DRAFT_1431285 [Trametes cingulata]|nr:hypothetical protein OH77DRAFT_1431285 [Trametes cingulata]